MATRKSKPEPASEEDGERGDSVEVHPAYHKAIMDELGPDLRIETLMERTGLKKNTVARFRTMELVTDETLRVFCAKAKMPYPILLARSRYEVQLFEAFQLLIDNKPDYLQDRMSDVLEMADIVRRELQIRARVKQPKR